MSKYEKINKFQLAGENVVYLMIETCNCSFKFCCLICTFFKRPFIFLQFQIIKFYDRQNLKSRHFT